MGRGERRPAPALGARAAPAEQGRPPCHRQVPQRRKAGNRDQDQHPPERAEGLSLPLQELEIIRRDFRALHAAFGFALEFLEFRQELVNGLFRVEADPRTGVIDMLAGPSAEELALFPTRVVELPGRRAAFTFTMFQWPGTPDDLFESQHASLRRELENVRNLFDAD